MNVNESQSLERKWTEQTWNHFLETREHAQSVCICLHLFVMQGQLPVLGQKNPNSGHAVAKKALTFLRAWQRSCMLLCFASEACRHTHLSSRYSYRF
jgi:hypothetical protein